MRSPPGQGRWHVRVQVGVGYMLGAANGMVAQHLSPLGALALAALATRILKLLNLSLQAKIVVVDGKYW